MRERSLFSLLLGVSTALHGGALALLDVPEPPVAEPRETVIEIDLSLHEAVMEPAPLSPAADSQEPPEAPDRIPKMPEAVATPGDLPELETPDPFAGSPSEASFLPQNPGPPGDTGVPRRDPRVLMEYRDVVRSWLERHKEYPRAAERREVEGRPVLRLVIGPRGRVLHASIAESSGTPILDQAALGLVERAAPFPRFPDHVQEPSLEYFIPVLFELE